jgi:photosystem II stability/assembly factor-like uncharacterized protein
LDWLKIINRNFLNKMTKLNKILCFALLLICFVSVKADWKKVNSGTFAWLQSVSFVNQNKGWIVGAQGTLLETNDGGATWKAKPKFTSDLVRDVYFSDEQTGWILCERDIYNLGDLSPSYLLQTANGGETWQKVNLVGGGRERLSRIFFSADGFGRAVGEAGAFYSMQDDRNTWKKTSLPVQFRMLDGNFFNQNRGLIVGGGGTALLTEDGGNSWNKANFTAQSNSKLNAVFFINQQTGWAVGAEGKIFATANGGKFWRAQNSPLKTDLFDVFFLNSAEGWAVGDNGIILQTSTGGNVWKAFQMNARHRLERIFFVGQKGFAVGFGGTILKYEKTNRETNPTRPAPNLQKRHSTSP